jgi:malate dehydrogenase (oxaloacetate-decarboxylating)(NADP+)
VLPFVYTPVVGEACEKYSHLPITPRGLYVTIDDLGAVLDKLRRFRPQANLPHPNPPHCAPFNSRAVC